MPRARRFQESLEATRYYHCIGRCVRQQFLCGFDAERGVDYSHRRQWIVDELNVVSQAFAVSVCGYAILSNHYHLVVRIDPEEAASWCDEEVVRRWCQVYRGTEAVRKWRAGEALAPAEQREVQELIPEYRQRLADLSWFMRRLNEPIARRANAEDDCTGHFWEGRFRSQALLDEAALLTCLAYVDLNPVRAGVAARPEDSDFTSIQQRIKATLRSRTSASSEDADTTAHHLVPFADHAKPGEEPLPFHFLDYVELVDWSGRITREGKAGISEAVPPILERLSIDPDTYCRFLRNRGTGFHYAVGPVAAIRDLARIFRARFLKGQQMASQLFSSPA